MVKIKYYTYKKSPLSKAFLLRGGRYPQRTLFIVNIDI
jgi:hypothetical protein